MAYGYMDSPDRNNYVTLKCTAKEYDILVKYANRQKKTVNEFLTSFIESLCLLDDMGVDVFHFMNQFS